MRATAQLGSITRNTSERLGRVEGKSTHVDSMDIDSDPMDIDSMDIPINKNWDLQVLIEPQIKQNVIEYVIR